MPTILRQIREGMTVYDANGREIGTVDFVHLSDEDPSALGPQTVTVSPAVRDDRHSWIDVVADVFRSDAVPEVLRDRLLRSGFIRVEAKGLFAADRYVLPDQIASVSEDQVRLAVGRDQLVKRG